MTGEPQVFEYAVLRVVPRVDRGEIMNAGVLLYCRPLRYLGARVALDTDRLLALDPEADLPGVARALAAAAQVCGPDVASADVAGTGLASTGLASTGLASTGLAGTGLAGTGLAGAGAAGLQEIGRRFRWLTAPRSTVVQPGPVHTGLTADPDAEIDRLLQALVLRPR